MKRTKSNRRCGGTENRRPGGLIRILAIFVFTVAVLLTGPMLMEKLTAGGDRENLLLVNGANPLPDGYRVDLTELSNGEAVADQIYPALQQMMDDARAAGVYPVVASGYRTAAKQQSLLDEKIQTYVEQGYSQTEAETLAATYVSLPSTSEHQTGLAVDLNADPMKSTADQVYTWLYENAYQYGFILRYPKGKEELTGTNYEAWHYRYVGKQAAKAIYEQGLCLEEYLEQGNPSTDKEDNE